MRKNLVIVRAGEGSLHETWLGGGERSWDLIVNYFGDNPHKFKAPGIRRIDSKGPKWPALQALMNQLGDELLQYDYVWLPDDDLASVPENVERMFSLCLAHRFELAQPALSLDSYVGHLITLANRNFVFRYTTFVEIMAPCFSAPFLRRCRPTFGANISGWGLDLLWSSWVSHWSRIAILDVATVRHTRPMGGPSYQIVRESGRNALDECEALKKEYGIVRDDIFITGGLTHSGQRLLCNTNTHGQLVVAILGGYFPELAQASQMVIQLLWPSIGAIPPMHWTPQNFRRIGEQTPPRGVEA